MAEEKKDRLMYALSCYIEKRREVPVGDASNAITALYRLEKEDNLSIPEGEHRAEGVPSRRRESSWESRTGRARNGPAHRRAYPDEEDHILMEDHDVQSERTPRARPPIPPPVSHAAPSHHAETMDDDTDVAEQEERMVVSHEKNRPRNTCEGCGLSLRRGESEECNSCGAGICNSCGEYAHVHKDSPIFFDYRFASPLCKECYLCAFKVQEEMGRASTYFRTGNFTYAARHAKRAVELSDNWPGGDIYREKAVELLESIEGNRPRMDGRSRMKQQGGKKREPIDDIKGDKWTRKFVERALSRKEE